VINVSGRFSKSLTRARIMDTVNQKLMWLVNVLSARDNEIHVGPMRQRNLTIITIYDRWKKKNNV
jgi:hypothetical protein